MTQLGIVIRTDGTVPFDDGVHPDVRTKILKALAQQGHVFDDVPGTSHVKIRNWK